jgi:hypothetical protein
MNFPGDIDKRREGAENERRDAALTIRSQELEIAFLLALVQRLEDNLRAALTRQSGELLLNIV